MECNEAEKKIYPYIRKELENEETEEFLEHVETCRSCQEELEVNYIIYHAVRMDNENDSDMYDMRKLLKADIKRTKERLQVLDGQIFIRKFATVIFISAMILMLVLCVDSYISGGYSGTWISKALSTDAIIIEAETETEKQIMTEQETNHKKEVIIQTPETERYQEPGLIPD